MRLAYLTSQYPATSHTFIRREVVALRERGMQVDTFSIRSPAPEEVLAEADRSEAERTFYVLRQPATAFVAAHLGAMVRRPGAYLKTLALALGHRALGARGLFLALAHFTEAVLLARELRRRGVTHLHNHFANSAATVGLLARRLLGIGWSFTMHGISETDYPAGLLLPSKIEAADMVVCVSWFGRAQGMRVVAPKHWGKFQVVRCGLPLADLPAPAAATSPKTIVSVGRLSPEKGQAGLIEAFAAAVQKDFPEMRLQFVGEGPDRAFLQRRARELGIEDRTLFSGRVPEDQTLAVIASAQLLVLPSFMEGLPIVLMEAMAIGVPVIASRVAGIPELVRDGTTGLLFTPSNWDELGACIRRLLVDESLRRRLVTDAKATVSTEFDVRRSAQQLTALFAERGR